MLLDLETIFWHYFSQYINDWLTWCYFVCVCGAGGGGGKVASHSIVKISCLALTASMISIMKKYFPQIVTSLLNVFGRLRRAGYHDLKLEVCGRSDSSVRLLFQCFFRICRFYRIWNRWIHCCVAKFCFAEYNLFLRNLILQRRIWFSKRCNRILCVNLEQEWIDHDVI